jgi:hypothetical protein
LVYRTGGRGRASIADKFSVKKKLAQEQNAETKRVSAVPLHVKGYALKLHTILSWGSLYCARFYAAGRFGLPVFGSVSIDCGQAKYQAYN